MNILNRICKFFDDRERMHREIGELVSKIDRLEHELDVLRSEYKSLELTCQMLSGVAGERAVELQKLRTLLPKLQDAEALVQAVTTFRRVLGTNKQP